MCCGPLRPDCRFPDDTLSASVFTSSLRFWCQREPWECACKSKSVLHNSENSETKQMWSLVLKGPSEGAGSLWMDTGDVVCLRGRVLEGCPVGFCKPGSTFADLLFYRVILLLVNIEFEFKKEEYSWDLSRALLDCRAWETRDSALWSGVGTCDTGGTAAWPEHAACKRAVSCYTGRNWGLWVVAMQNTICHLSY